MRSARRDACRRTSSLSRRTVPPRRRASSSAAASTVSYRRRRSSRAASTARASPNAPRSGAACFVERGFAELSARRTVAELGARLLAVTRPDDVPHVRFILERVAVLFGMALGRAHLLRRREL